MRIVPSFFASKTKKLLLELFSQTSVTSSRNPMNPPTRDITLKKSSNLKLLGLFKIEARRLSAL